MLRVELSTSLCHPKWPKIRCGFCVLHHLTKNDYYHYIAIITSSNINCKYNIISIIFIIINITLLNSEMQKIFKIQNCEHSNLCNCRSGQALVKWTCTTLTYIHTSCLTSMCTLHYFFSAHVSRLELPQSSRLQRRTMKDSESRRIFSRAECIPLLNRQRNNLLTVTLTSYQQHSLQFQCTMIKTYFLKINQVKRLDYWIFFLY